MDDLKLKPRPVIPIEDTIFVDKEVENKSFVNHRFKDVGAKGVTFRNCDFSFSVHTRSYFRDSTFENCKFIGAWFYDSNLREAKLVQCDFSYSSFRGTLIDPLQIVANLPPHPNVKRQLLQALRVNAQSIGDTDAVKSYVREEMLAVEEHFRKARDRKESYYKRKYPGFRNWWYFRWQTIGEFLDRQIWGGGEYPSRPMWFILVVLVLLALVLAWQNGLLSSKTTLDQVGPVMLKSFKATILVFLGITRDNEVSVHWVIESSLVLFRYVMIGLFISVLFRWFSKR